MGHFAAHAARPPLQKKTHTRRVFLLFTTVVVFFRGMHVCVFVSGMHLFFVRGMHVFFVRGMHFFVRGMHVFCLPSTSMAMRKLEHC